MQGSHRPWCGGEHGEPGQPSSSSCPGPALQTRGSCAKYAPLLETSAGMWFLDTFLLSSASSQGALAEKAAPSFSEDLRSLTSSLQAPFSAHQPLPALLLGQIPTSLNKPSGMHKCFLHPQLQQGRDLHPPAAPQQLSPPARDPQAGSKSLIFLLRNSLVFSGSREVYQG